MPLPLSLIRTHGVAMSGARHRLASSRRALSSLLPSLQRCPPHIGIAKACFLKQQGLPARRGFADVASERSRIDEDPNRKFFKVKGDGVDINKLAGGISYRLNNNLEVVLEGMGDRSIYNCIRALVMVNRFAAKEQEDYDSFTFSRAGFIPSLAREKDGSRHWMRLRVVTFSEPASDPSQAAQLLKVSSNTEFENLRKAIYAEWTNACRSQREDDGGPPRILLAGMGPKCTTIAVKSAAFVLRQMQLNDRSYRLFCCWPEMKEETLQPSGDTITRTFLSFEERPKLGRSLRGLEPNRGKAVKSAES
eukprot:TRINITY_DN7126_c0_g4_i1.p1 TRINITY_DN7126_c0_g4~~TRINITY_DN7126_c0_g4_i1.p1  ORF type:complete len:306 (+),score=44.02 TRINITY_DN7126_c0_g4_i1:8-925(+)